MSLFKNDTRRFHMKANEVNSIMTFNSNNNIQVTSTAVLSLRKVWPLPLPPIGLDLRVCRGRPPRDPGKVRVTWRCKARRRPITKSAVTCPGYCRRDPGPAPCRRFSLRKRSNRSAVRLPIRPVCRVRICRRWRDFSVAFTCAGNCSASSKRTNA